MQARISYATDHLRNSFWFTPALMTFGAVLLSVLTLAVDENVQSLGLDELLYSGGPDGAREVLSAIASSMITVAGVVFSITIVVLALASGQFGPRLLENFMRDRGNQITLGTFVATFLYALLILRTIRTDSPDVPIVSVTVALLLAIAGLSVLIYFIHHISTTIQAPNLVARIGAELDQAVHRLFPDTDDVEGGGVPETGPKERPSPSTSTAPATGGEGHRVLARSSGHLQLIDLDTLVRRARHHDLVIQVDTRPGRFVVQHTPLGTVWARKGETAGDEPAADVADDIAAAFVTGTRRTPVQDIEFPIMQLVEIAVRALSPAINDPFTASTCVNQLGVGLCGLAGRDLPPTRLTDEDGSVRVVIGDPVTFERLVGTAYDQIRQAADFHAVVYIHLLEALAQVAYRAGTTDRLTPLLTQGKLVIERAETAVPAEADRAVIRERHDTLLVAARQTQLRLAGSDR